MSTKSGFKQVNFQLPDKTYQKLEEQCKELGINKSEFCSRLIVEHFLLKELGYNNQLLSFYETTRKL